MLRRRNISCLNSQLCICLVLPLHSKVQSASVPHSKQESHVLPGLSVSRVVQWEFNSESLAHLGLRLIDASKDADAIETLAVRHQLDRQQNPSFVDLVLQLGFAWEMVKSKRLSQSWLPDRCVDAFRELADHVLGSHVAGLRAPGGHAPSWSMVLVYEGELRKAAYRYVRDGASPDLREAIKRACNAPEVMSAFFVVPFTLAGSEQASSVEPTSLAMPAPETWWQRGGGKGKGKGRASQVEKIIGKSYRTPDNKCICFWFNRKTGYQQEDCKYEHVCQRCFAKHSYVHCPLVKRPTSDE